jgi:hypothetical protein
MALQTRFVIGRGVCLQLLVRVMAGGTRKSCISFSPALACNQTVRRRPRGGDTFHSSEFYIPPGAVTRPTEIDRIRGIKVRGVEDGWLRLCRRSCGCNGLDMASARSVTGFTSHTRNQMALVEMSSDARAGRMTTETPHHLRLGNGTVHSLFDPGGRQQRARWREVDGSKGFEVRDPGLEKICIRFLEQIRLTHAPSPECPEQWKRQALIPITHRIAALTTRSAVNPILILARAKGHQRMRMQNVGKRSRHRGVCHRSFFLRGDLDAVTPRASVGSGKIVSRSDVLRRPEPRLGEVVLRRELAESSRGTEAHCKKKADKATTLQTPEHFIRFPFQEEWFDSARQRHHPHPSYCRLDFAGTRVIDLPRLITATSKEDSILEEDVLGATPVEARTMSAGSMTISA